MPTDSLDPLKVITDHIDAAVNAKMKAAWEYTSAHISAMEFIIVHLAHRLEGHGVLTRESLIASLTASRETLPEGISPYIENAIAHVEKAIAVSLEEDRLKREKTPEFRRSLFQLLSESQAEPPQTTGD